MAKQKEIKTLTLEKAKAFDIIVSKGVLTLWNNKDLEFPIKAIKLFDNEVELFNKFIPIAMIPCDEEKPHAVWDGSSLRRTITDDELPNTVAADMPLIHYNIIVDADIVGGVIKHLISYGYHNIEIKKHDSNNHKVFFTLE